ncbi:MAG TPA: hypothetical protein VLE97_01740 [Gaiellaceae bacterium]|nr:hypothetical protein [Gaiellaceae bacterium]
MTAPVVMVAGLGRCGTSLVMQMLHAVGFPCIGEWPAFEPTVSAKPMTAADLVPIAGHAMKRLNPQRIGIPGMTTRTIWLDRDPDEQAASMIQFARETEGVDMAPNRASKRRLVASLRRDRALAIVEIGRRPYLRLSFENLISAPQTAACNIVDFLGIAPADTAKMSMCVVQRVNGAHAQPTLAVELMLTTAAERMGAVAE